MLMEQVISELLHEIQGLRADLNDLKNEVAKNTIASCRDETILGIEEAATLCGVSRQTISTWINRNRLTKVSSKGKTGVAKSELLALRREPRSKRKQQQIIL